MKPTLAEAYSHATPARTSLARFFLGRFTLPRTIPHPAFIAVTMSRMAFLPSAKYISALGIANSGLGMPA